MNYKSQLKGWAVDRVIELSKIFPIDMTTIPGGGALDPLTMVHTYADKLAAYAYIPREDLESTAKDLFELVRNAPANEASIDALIGTLEHIKHERVSQGIDAAEPTVEAANAN